MLRGADQTAKQTGAQPVLPPPPAPRARAVVVTQNGYRAAPTNAVLAPPPSNGPPQGTPQAKVQGAKVVPPGAKGHAPPPGGGKAPSRMMTADELVAGVGHKPKSAPLMSQRYDKVIHKIDKFNERLADARIPSDPGARATLATKLEADLDLVDQAAQAYLQEHPSSKAMQKLRNDVVAEKQLLQAVLKDTALADPTLNAGHGFSVQQAMELRRYGIDPTSQITFDERHTDDRLKKDSRHLASGAVNAVALAKYRDGEKRVLKPEPQARAEIDVDLRGGIDKAKPHYGNRNIATARLDEIMGTGLVPGTQYTIHHDRLHMSMELAPGVSGNGVKTMLDVPKTDPAYGQIQSELLKIKSGQSKTTTDLELYVQDLKVTLEVDDNGDIASLQRAGHIPYDIDYRDPNLTRSLSNLEWLDFITGQADRHPGNFLMNFDRHGVFKSLKAIDQDSSFAERMDPQTWFKNRAYDQGYNGIGVPLLIDHDLASKLLDPKTWPRMEAALKELLMPAEVVAAKARYDAAVTAIKAMPADRFIADWTIGTVTDTDPTSGQAVKLSPAEFLIAHPSQSYVGRGEAMIQHRIADGLTPLPLPH